MSFRLCNEQLTNIDMGKPNTTFLFLILFTLIDYGLPVWGNICESLQLKLDEFMFRIYRKIFKTPSVHVKSNNCILQNMNWLLFNERRQVHCLKFFFKHVVNSDEGTPLKTLFTGVISSRIQRTIRTLRKPMNFDHIKSGTYGQKSFTYYTVKLWNSLSHEIQTMKFTSLFESAIRTKLVSSRIEIDFLK